MKTEDILTKGSSRLGIPLSAEQTALLMRYMEILKLWNTRINLTSLTNDSEIAVSHFLDSLSAAPFIGPAPGLLDIGSGAGFPGIPLKIASPSLTVTLMDSVHKKIAFMNEVIRELGLTGISAVWGRAEDPGNGVPRGAFHCVISRAVGSVPGILRLSAPYLAPGGRIILMRGRRGAEEWDSSQEELGGAYRLIERKSFMLPYGGQTRVIFVIEPT